MKIMRFDATSGDLHQGAVYEINTGYSVNLRLCIDNKRTIVSFDNAEFSHNCKLDKGHETGLSVEEIRVDVVGGGPLGNFVPPVNHGFAIISPDFAARLRDSGLTGFECRPIVKVNVDQTDSGLERLYYMEVLGRAGNCSRRLRVEGGPGLCPFCGAVPVVCPGCGEFNDPCPRCGRNTLVHTRSEVVEDEPRIFYDFGGRPKPFVVEERDWDGSDWFYVDGRVGGGFISGRAKAWLEESRVHDIQITPALLARK